ncbi:MAG: hypothetical protein GY859_38380, partial [Desulfobacterales bacterium]|nr:hypothetical protein [Desulfobacterales bacterium]
MYISSRKEILQGFAEEVKGYTPSLKQELDACMAAPDSGAFERLFRLVHTIRGAASMVGVSGLSQMASQMEKALLAVSSGELALDAKGYQVMDLTIGRFDAYADGLLQGVVDEVGLMTETVLAFRRLRGLPREEDQDALASLPDFILAAKEEAAPPGATIHDNRIHFPEEDPAPAADPDPGLDLDILLEPKESGVESGRKSGKESGRESVKEPAGEADLDLDLDILLKPFEGEEASASSFPYPDLLEDFHQEAEDHLEEIGRALNRLQAEILEPVPVSPRLRDVVHDIQRAVHTLKGAASVVKFTEIAALAHGMEDLLDWLHDTVDLLTPEIVSLLTESADLLARITAEPDESRTDLIDALTDRYEILIKERAGGDPTAAASPADEVGIDADAFFEIEMEESDEEASDVAPAPDAALLDEPNADSGIGGEGVAGEDVAGEDVPRAPVESAAEVLPTKTIRVGMDRVDDLVNLAGELIIGLSAFDQQLDSFRESLDELELSRNRLRESARNLESGYEVKAIRRLGSENAPAGRGRRPEESEESEEFDSLELDRYSEFNLLIRGLNESVVDVGAINAQLD